MYEEIREVLRIFNLHKAKSVFLPLDSIDSLSNELSLVDNGECNGSDILLSNLIQNEKEKKICRK